MRIVIVVILVICFVAVLGVLIGLQQIVTYQAQIAFKEYDSVYKAQIDSSTIHITPLSLHDCLGNARCITGIVTDAIDGDTIKVDGQSIRFALVSPTELGELKGITSRDFINSICPIGSTATIDEDDRQIQGNYEEIIGVIYCNGKNLNEELINSGYGSLNAEFCSSSEFSNSTWAKKHGC